jgi:UDP-N-acetylglucosamine 2-epimerase (non-hydrolysing)/GDP/UDP-N,N'-diacetylbacillosamine 2-epimerase (hydrolysing)
MAKRKICVVTGSRAEYGILYWLLKEIQEDSDLILQVVVTGMHLSVEHGLTYRVIEDDGFAISAKVEMLLASDTPVGIAKSVGVGIMGFADAFAVLKPDIVVLNGDRFDIFAAAQAAMIARIPIAHTHGGEATEGLLDEAIRHSVTKMSSFHFVAAEPYRRRVIQLGESPERVFNVGTPGLDNLKRLKLLDRRDFEKASDFKLGTPTFLVTYHPVTLSKTPPREPMENLLRALNRFPEAKIIFTKANADTEGRIINEMIDQYVHQDPMRAKAFISMGQVLYLSALTHVDVVIGNSSSGLTEAPAVRKATVNIGDRQRGRLRASSVIDCTEDESAIVSAIRKALSPGFREALKNVSSPYGEGNASVKIKKYLKEVNLDDVLMKRFYDIKEVS